MRKRILVVVLAMTLAFAYAVPVAGAETEPVVPESPVVENTVESVDTEADESIVPDGTEGSEADESVIPNGTESTDPDESVSPNGIENTDAVSEDLLVDAIYGEYKNMEAALESCDYAVLEESYNNYNAMVESGAYREKQQEEWERVVNDVIGADEWWDVLISTATIIYANELYAEYLADKNAKTAYEFVTVYDELTEWEYDFDKFVPGAAADYEDAMQNYMASEKVINVYDAYVEVSTVLAFGYDKDFVKACKKFEAVLDDFNSLTEDELDDLAELMGEESGEDAWNKVFSDWVDANLILQIGEAYDAFIENPDAETAKAYIDVYDSVKNDTEFLTDEDKEFILGFFADGSYERAETYLKDEPESKPAEPQQPDKSDKGTPPTGDETNMLVPFAVMIAAAGVAALAVKRRKVQ